MNTIPQPYFNKESKTLYLNTLENNPLILKVKEELKDIEVAIFITAITKEESEKITQYLKKEIPEEELENFYVKFGHIGFDYIIAHGDGNDGGSTIFGVLLQKKPYNVHSPLRDEQYRSYEQTYEYWVNNPYVNMCPDKKMSYESVLRKLGAEGVHGIENSRIPFYTVIWVDGNFGTRSIKESYGL